MVDPIARLWTGDDWKEALKPAPELSYILMCLGQRCGTSAAFKECVRFVGGGILAPGQRRLTSRRAEAAFAQLDFKDVEGKSLADMSNSDMEDLRKIASSKFTSKNEPVKSDGERVLALIGRNSADPKQLVLEHGTPANDLAKKITNAMAQLPRVPIVGISTYTIPAFNNDIAHPLYDYVKVVALALSCAMIVENEYAVTCLRYTFNDFKKDVKLALHAKEVLGFTSCQHHLTFKRELIKAMTQLEDHLNVLCACLSLAAPTWVQLGEHKDLRPADRGTFHEEYRNTQIGLGNKQM